MNFGKQKPQKPKLHIHTTEHRLTAIAEPPRGRLPFMAAAILIIIILTKFVIPDWWFPTPADFKPVTVPIERTQIPETIPDPEPEAPKTRELYGPPAPVNPQPEPDHIPVWKQNSIPVELLPDHKYIAIVIDDMGVNVAKSREMLTMPSVLTLAFLPYAHDVAVMASEAGKNGHELMVHIPMEPLDPTINAGEDVLRVSLTPEELSTAIDSNLSKFSVYIGINNHMGSRFTQDAAALGELMRVLKERELVLLDSKTIAGSKAYALAVTSGVPALERDVFLDDDPALLSVRHQLRVLEEIAEKKGYAIAIGHPKAATIQALREWLPTLADKGIQLVPLSALVTQPETGSVVQSHPLPTEPPPAPSAPSPETHSPGRSPL